MLSILRPAYEEENKLKYEQIIREVKVKVPLTGSKAQRGVKV
jgi:hypothetical protein